MLPRIQSSLILESWRRGVRVSLALALALTGFPTPTVSADAVTTGLRQSDLASLHVPEALGSVVETWQPEDREFVRVTSRIEVVAADPADNKFLACALDGRAELLVNGDDHLLRLKAFHHIPILSARQFLDRLA